MKFILDFSVLIQLYKHKHLILIFDHEHKIRFKQNFTIRLPIYEKMYGKKNLCWSEIMFFFL